MTTRRAFFSHLATAVAGVALAPLALPIRRPDARAAAIGEATPGQLSATLEPAEVYHPYGHLLPDDAMAFHIRAVLLDGEDITREGVVESDDRAGWVRVIVRGEKVWMGDHFGPKIVRRTGDVRYVWSEEALT